MRNHKMFAIVALAGSALLMPGASAQQPAPQAAAPSDGQVPPCPPGGQMGPGHGMARGPGPGMGPGAGQGMGPGPMAGQMGGMMGMDPQEMRQMHADMAAMREEMRQLREELRARR